MTSTTSKRPYAEVIGDPINQSKSPVIHGFWLDKLGIDADYKIAHIKPEQLVDYITSRREDPDWQGCNVTIPHKLAVLDLVDDPGGVKDSIGAMNTIIRGEDGKLIGTNTDAGGFYTPLSNSDLAGADICVIGNGGAARAILFALSRLDVDDVYIMARNPLKSIGLLSQFGLKGGCVQMDAEVPPVQLLVNASPLGMKGAKETLDIDLTPLPDGAIVYDIVYNPLITPLLEQAKSRGLNVIDGLGMLIGQADLAFELFFGKPAPRKYDKELRKLLAK
ncbi:shikimate dehydrogenase [Sphingorhabdus sp. Alg239-R122]|uniref:shikimate dehydrogenase n=1 Tax=Sphingorhabdus sp. Alg239-R122 TaxID=2305989 RepID=UPI0013DB7724|nr:shikimate dehydrogenase [Sphingorhabdus sp. Alg239-R122]